MKVSDFVIERLSQWRVNRIYGYPGDGINPLLGALGRTDADLKFIQVRHEVMASFMACAHAKFTGEPGVCMATAGPGAIQLLNGLYDAKMDHQPVVAIIGQQPRSSLGTDFLQDVDLLSLFKDVAHEYVHVATVPDQVQHLIDRAFRIAMSEKTVTCVILPKDLQDAEFEDKPRKEHGKTNTGVGYNPPHVVPAQADLKSAASILNECEKLAILVGAGALHAGDLVQDLAEILGAGVAKALLGKAALPDSLSYVTGSIGMLGTEASQRMMSNCDALLMIGSNFPYSEFLPKVGQARAVQIDLDSSNLSLRYPMDVCLTGDSRETIKALLPLLRRKADREWQEQIREWKEASEQVLQDRAAEPADPVNPQLLFQEVSPLLPTDSIISADSGTSTVWYARYIKIKTGMMASVSGGLASMGCAVPYAIAAKFAYPERPAFAFVGDGAMQMNGNAELLTIAKYWREWQNPKLVIFVMNNRDLNFVSWEMRAREGMPKFEPSQDLPAFSYADFAETLGLTGITIRSSDQIASALAQAFQSERPVVVDVHVDPSVPPLPSEIGIEEAKSIAMSVVKGDTEAAKHLPSGVGQFVKDVFQRYFQQRA